MRGGGDCPIKIYFGKDYGQGRKLKGKARLKFSWKSPTKHAYEETLTPFAATRRAAKMVCLDIDHPDIVEFIECKESEEKKACVLEAKDPQMLNNCSMP